MRAEQILGRLRSNPLLRELFSETRLSPAELIMPYFVIEGRNKKEAVKSMPGVFRYSGDELLKEISDLINFGVRSILLFGIPSKKDLTGFSAYKKDNLVAVTVDKIKNSFPEVAVITDVCLCSYTAHGHCGILKSGPQSKVNSPQKWSKNRNLLTIDNDATLDVLAKIALSHIKAGADMVAPSAMADGQVSAIRTALDENGFKNASILAYSAKYASNFYGPFRTAADCKPLFGDRKKYQLNFSSSREALREAASDISEGADAVMVKPALMYLDVIREIKEKLGVPLAAYNVSGEYSMLKLAAKNGVLDELPAAIEMLTAIKRAGADVIITYYAKSITRFINK